MTAQHPFHDLPADAATHFRLAALGLVLALEERHPGLAAALPHIEGYRTEAGHLMGTATPSAAAFAACLAAFTAQHPGLPLARIAAALPSPQAAEVLVAVAMVEEDPVLGFAFEPEGGRPSIGGLTAMLRSGPTPRAALELRAALGDLLASGCLALPETASPRADQTPVAPSPLLDALLGLPVRAAGLTHLPAAALPPHRDWIAPAPGVPTPDAVGRVLATGEARILLLRGPAANGRATFVGMAAGAAGLGLVTIDTTVQESAELFRTAQALAFALGAMLMVRPPPGVRTARLFPPHPAVQVPLAVTGPADAGVTTAPGQPLLTVDLPLPDSAARRRHWHAAGLAGLARGCEGMALSAGNLRRVATGARAEAALHGRPRPGPRDARVSARAMKESRLAGLAQPVGTDGPPEPLFLDPATRTDLDLLEARIRLREPLAAAAPAGRRGRGVAALLAGPSGSGKTLAARHLAHALGMDLFRLDLAATVSKYIGETEKNLEATLAAAEELDLLLLLDEGDSLLARRTEVSSSHDRYANLETNYLLQRLERFEGVLLVTSNEASRIDQAFARRFDARISFRAADAVQRLAILEGHLGAHEVAPDLLADVASRCILPGGELRQVAETARLAAMAGRRAVGNDELRAAVEAVYRRANADCPLKPAPPVVVAVA